MPENDKQLNLPKREEKILEFWEREKIFDKSLENRRRNVERRQKPATKLHSTLHTPRSKIFVFYEGPPTANGSPGIHHFESRAFKDVIPRYKTMRGFNVPRKAGWDTHGLPVELQVEKELGFKHKRDIERYGIAEFNEKCRESVWRYKEEWDRFTKRIGFWLDLEHPYITYETSYMETLWWIMKEVWKKGLLYRDFKIVPWCPRCETGLSSHELGQPGAYRKVKDISIFVRMKIKARPRESLLIWTTTPWTLPANVAVAANPKIEYTKYKISDEYVWSATTPPYDPKVVKPEIIEKVSGASLIGIEYEPLYQPKLQATRLRAARGQASYKLQVPYKVVGADFVETEEGTGFVHLAPAFGEEDMTTIKSKFKIQNLKSEVDYPILETVNPDGTMKKGVIGEGKFVKDADAVIIEDLKKRKLLFAAAPYEHDYPHCWRCDTPLLYYAKNAWWIRMTELKKSLIKNNETIDWIPEHIKRGRFGEFLKDVRDWAFSRERYWGTPLPIWQCRIGKSQIPNSKFQINSKSQIQSHKQNGCGNLEAIGSLEELAERAPQSGNTYFAMRHGEAETQLLGIAADSNSKYHLTEKGKKQIERAAEKLEKEKIDVIIHSDVMRTREAAHILSKILGVKDARADSRIHELNVGIFDGRPTREYHAYYSSMEEKFTKSVPEGESLNDLKKRLMDFMRDIDRKYKNKKILIVSHEYPIWVLDGASRGLDNKGIIRLRGKKADYIGLAQVIKIPFRRLPRDNRGEVNLHRPYVDEFEIVCKKCGGKMKRVKEVVDVWFDSGAMPFAQAHYPFAFAQTQNSKLKSQKLLYPADFISEAVDQTRGWFYTLLAVATLLGKGAPYRHVISLGHVLDRNGQKMSKSKGNVVNPWDMIQKYGADAIRWYFYTINPAGEPKRFDEKDLQNKLRGTLSTLWNSFVFFDTYVDKIQNSKFKIQNSRNVLDRWVMARLKEVVASVSERLDKYDVVGAARVLDEFIVEDFSNWHLRRSRRRFQKPESAGEKAEATSTLFYSLVTLARLFAPFTPFLAEAVWRGLGDKARMEMPSVHLGAWPEAPRLTKEEGELVENMKAARELAALALAERAKAGIKVRQPLQKFKIQNSKFKIKELLDLVKEEVNVKEIVIDHKISSEIELDTVITKELREEGWMRELVRNAQEMRRDLNLRPVHKIKLQLVADAELSAVLGRWKEWLMKEAGAKEFFIGGKKMFRAERELSLDGHELWAGIEKI